MDKRILISLLLILPITVGVLQVSSGASSEWIVNVGPTTVYIDEPVQIKIYSYSVSSNEIYTVSCNMTLTNGTDVLWQRSISGKPLVYNFTINKTGSYTLEMYCEDDVGQSKSLTYEIRVLYPTPSLKAKAMWDRPVDMVITTPYKYNGTPVSLVYQGVEYNGTLNNGTIELQGLPPILKPENVSITLFNRTTYYMVTPTLPSLVITHGPTSIGMYESTWFTMYLRDSIGVLDVNKTIDITFVPNGCGLAVKEQGPYYLGEEYQVYVPKPTDHDLDCYLRGTVQLWDDPTSTVSSQISIHVESLKITSKYINITRITPWRYVITEHVDVSQTVNGTLILYLDGRMIDAISTLSDSITITKTVDIDQPGLHVVSGKYIYWGGSTEIKGKTILVPKHEYNINISKTWIWAGDYDLINNNTISSSYFYKYVKDGYVYLILYYPGNNYYLSKTEIVKVKIVTPTIQLTEKKIKAENVAPNSTIRIYCVNSGKTTMIMELLATKTELEAKIPISYDCGSVYAVYKYKNYTQIVYANQPKPINVVTNYCVAGVPCTLLTSNNDITFAEIGGSQYVPGNQITLKAGYYTLTVHSKDGFTFSIPIHVEQPEIIVEAYKVLCENQWHVVVDSPSNIKVSVVLASGRVLHLGPGEYDVDEKPVNAFWSYGKVDFKVITVLP